MEVLQEVFVLRDHVPDMFSPDWRVMSYTHSGHKDMVYGCQQKWTRWFGVVCWLQ